jgi:hypothetical protein
MVLDRWHTPDCDGSMDLQILLHVPLAMQKVVTLRAGEPLDGCLEEMHVYHACRASSIKPFQSR